jgi:hypothetical protein
MKIEYIKGVKMIQRRKNMVIAAKWYADNVLSLSDSDATIQIAFKKGLIKEISNMANCAWNADTKTALITVDADVNKYIAFNTIAHEMVHAKQWIRGQLSHTKDLQYMKWNGKKVCAKLAYHETPWEIEAMSKEVIMGHAFFQACF